LLVLKPRSYEGPKLDGFGHITSEDGFTKYWKNTGADVNSGERVQFRTAQMNHTVAKAAQTANQQKAQLLIWATWLAFSGVGCLALVLVYSLR
jgi:hypothetical protein